MGGVCSEEGEDIEQSLKQGRRTHSAKYVVREKKTSSEKREDVWSSLFPSVETEFTAMKNDKVTT